MFQIRCAWRWRHYLLSHCWSLDIVGEWLSLLILQILLRRHNRRRKLRGVRAIWPGLERRWGVLLLLLWLLLLMATPNILNHFKLVISILITFIVTSTSCRNGSIICTSITRAWSCSCRICGSSYCAIITCSVWVQIVMSGCGSWLLHCSGRSFGREATPATALRKLLIMIWVTLLLVLMRLEWIAVRNRWCHSIAGWHLDTTTIMSLLLRGLLLRWVEVGSSIVGVASLLHRITANRLILTVCRRRILL